MFYTFSQNNSGGVWNGPRLVIVEADSPDEANERAQTYAGVYFYGCEQGWDCPCCGDRWYPVESYEGDPVPSYYGEPITKDTDEDVKIVLKDTTPEELNEMLGA